MKIIITESQYKRLTDPNYIWVLRRYKKVKDAFNETIKDVIPCNYKSFDEYEIFFYQFFMDELHPEYYLMDNFDYEGIKEVLVDLFYTDITEHYYDEKEKCL